MSSGTKSRINRLKKEQRVAAKKAPVLMTLRVIGLSASCEPIPLPDGHIAQGHTRVTLHVLTEKDEPASIDVPVTTYEQYFRPLFER